MHEHLANFVNLLSLVSVSFFRLIFALVLFFEKKYKLALNIFSHFYGAEVALTTPRKDVYSILSLERVAALEKLGGEVKLPKILILGEEIDLNAIICIF